MKDSIKTNLSLESNISTLNQILGLTSKDTIDDMKKKNELLLQNTISTHSSQFKSKDILKKKLEGLDNNVNIKALGYNSKGNINANGKPSNQSNNLERVITKDDDQVKSLANDEIENDVQEGDGQE